MAQQSLIQRSPIYRLSTAAIAAAPTDGTTQPHVIMSPETPTGLQTTGLELGLKAPSAGAAVAVAAGFSVVCWVWNPLNGSWFSMAAVDVPYGQLFVSFDLDAHALYFQVTAASVATPGDIDFHVAEQ